MPQHRVFSEIRLLNGSTGDPVLHVDYPDRDNALMFDAGENARLPIEKLADLEALFITHHHIDHFVGFDRIVRAVIDSDKVVSVFGPQGTIRKTYDRIRSYEYQYFPFQKIVLRVHDILEDRILAATLECRRRFPEPEVEESPWSGGTIFTNDEVSVEAIHADHTVPCLSYAFVERQGFHLDLRKIEKGLLRYGAWVPEVLSRLHAGDTKGQLTIQGGTFPVATLAQQYFRKSRGARVAWVTDTAWSDVSRPRLMQLAHRAERLYCDGFYSEKQARQAEKYRHMTATRAAELARSADVGELVLIHFSARYTGRYEALVKEAQEVFPRTSAEF